MKCWNKRLCFGNVSGVPYNNNLREREIPMANLYNVKVIVELEYEVECDNEDQAEEQGWNWEEYTAYSSVYSIDVEHLQDLEDLEEDEDNE